MGKCVHFTRAPLQSICSSPVTQPVPLVWIVEFNHWETKSRSIYLTRCLSVLDFWNVNLGVYYKLEKKSISKQTWFFVEFELDFYCLCSLQKSISKSNWFFNFLNSIFRNWKKIEWHSIFQKSSGDRQGDRLNLVISFEKLIGISIIF